MPRRLIALALLAAPLATGPAAAAVCDGLQVPEGFAQDCRRVPVEGRVSEEAVITPTTGAPTDLARLNLRELDRAEDAAAWSDPDEWLRSRLVVDVGGFAASLRGLTDDPGSLLGGPTARQAVDTVIVTLERWGRAALSGCEPAPPRPDARGLACQWGVAGFEAMMTQRLVSSGDRRFVVAWRSTEPRSFRRLEAIANSFAPS